MAVGQKALDRGYRAIPVAMDLGVVLWACYMPYAMLQAMISPVA